jgi:long-subunit acyl-CoA synthetase (AMP-forming)
MTDTTTSHQTVYKSRYDHPPLPPQTSVFHYLFPPAALKHLYAHSRFPDRLLAFIDPVTERTTTRKELRLVALRLSLGLRKDPGLHRTNDHTPVVMLFSQNSLDYPNVLFGAQAAGIVTTLANSGYTATELAHQIRDSTAQKIFVHPSLLPTVKAALKHLQMEGHFNYQAKPDVILMVRNQDVPEALKSSGIQSYEDLMASEEEVETEGWEGFALSETQSNEPALLCYSSGTVG